VKFIILAIIVIVLFIIFKTKLKRQSQGIDEQSEFSYRKLDVLFTPAERSFLGVLNQAIDEDTIVFGKVRVADVLAPQKGSTRSVWQKAFNKISSKHFDFVLCSKADLSVLCAIELDDSSHNQSKQKERDAFIEGACKSANFPLIRFVAKATYTVNDIKKELSQYLPSLQNDVINHPLIELEAPVVKTCPKCSSELITRTSKKGKTTGNEFLGCSAFPKCRYIESENA
jgi:very-short-patch-repair endonuclease